MTTKLVLEENVRLVTAREASNAKDLGMFRREIARMQEYDTEIRPERFANLIDRIKSKGKQIDAEELLRDFGDKEFLYKPTELSALVSIYNAFVEAAKIVPNGAINIDNPPNMGLEERSLQQSTFKELLKVKRSGNRSKYNDVYFAITDSMPGFKLIYGHTSLEPKPDTNTNNAYLYGLPNNMLDVKAPVAFGIGNVNANGTEQLKERRFMYIFGMNATSEEEIINSLVTLNDFPKTGRNGENYISYKLRHRTIGELNPPKSAILVHDEAQRARDLGLFVDVKVYELIGNSVKIPKGDPVIVGIDHFGNQYPIIYWAGDQGLRGKK